MRVREELTFCAVNDLDVASGSLTLKNLHVFNQRNRGTVSQINQAAIAHRERELQNGDGSDSSGFESCSEDSNEDDSDDGDNNGNKGAQQQQKGGKAKAAANLDDSFEEVVDKKKKKR